jgi:hypothetical protein
MTTPRPHNSKRVRPPRKGNRHQLCRHRERLTAETRQSFTESESSNYLRAEHIAQGA